MPPRDATGPTLAVFYFAWLAAVGTFGPFLAAFLGARGFAPRAAAWLLATLPLVRVIVTPAWTYAADRLRSPTGTLRVVALASLAAFATLPLARGPTTLALALVAYTVCRAPVGALADSAALGWSARTGGDFGRVRAWGSAGYLLAAFGVANSLGPLGHGPALALTTALLALGALAAWRLPATPARPSPPLGPSLRGLLRAPAVRRVLLAAMLQQVGLAPYDGLFAAWLLPRAGGLWTGVAIASGVACEIAVMVWARLWLARVGPRRALAVGCAASALRWVVTAVAPWPLAVAIQCLHALGFGLFFIAAVEAIDRAAPADVRASAQGVHYAVAFGLGAALALALAGALGGAAALHRTFLVAALASVAAGIVVAGLEPLPAAPTSPSPPS